MKRLSDAPPYTPFDSIVQAIGSGHLGLVIAYADDAYPPRVRVTWKDGPRTGHSDWLYVHECRPWKHAPTERGQRGAELLARAKQSREERLP